MSEIPQELALRMAACLRDMTKWSGIGFSHPGANALAEAREIVALLPEPVDPDLVEARRMASDLRGIDLATSIYVAGECDSEDSVQDLLAGIKRGRGLALKARAEGE